MACWKTTPESQSLCKHTQTFPSITECPHAALTANLLSLFKPLQIRPLIIPPKAGAPFLLLFLAIQGRKPRSKGRIRGCCFVAKHDLEEEAKSSSLWAFLSELCVNRKAINLWPLGSGMCLSRSFNFEKHLNKQLPWLKEKTLEDLGNTHSSKKSNASDDIVRVTIHSLRVWAN